MEAKSINIDFVDGFKLRTKSHAVNTINFLKTIPSNDEILIIKRQLIRSVTSVASNYRAACRGRSRAEFVSKLGIVHEEADEVLFWYELLKDLNIESPNFDKLLKESDEILRIVAKSVATSRQNSIKKN